MPRRLRLAGREVIAPLFRSESLVGYAALYVGSSGLLKLAGFVFLMWIARTLSVAQYANFGLLYAVQTGVATLGIAGIFEGVVGLLREHRSEEARLHLFSAANEVFLALIGVSSLLLLIVCALALPGQAGVSTLLCVVVSGCLLAFGSFQSQIVRLSEQHGWSATFNFVVPMAGLCGGLVAFLARRGVAAFFVGSAIGTLAAVLVLWQRRVGFYGIAGSDGIAREILKRVWPFLAVAVLGWLSGYGNNYIVKMFFTSADIASFTFVLTVSSVIQMIGTAMNQVWSPRFYRIVHELPVADVEKMNRRFYRLQAAAIGAVGATLVLLMRPVARLIGGNLSQYGSLTWALGLICVAYVVLVPWWHALNYFLAHDQGRSVMNIVLTSSVIGIAVWVVLMWAVGPIGIYLGFLAQMLLRSGAILALARKQWPLRIAWDGVAVGTAVVIGAMYFARLWT